MSTASGSLCRRLARPGWAIGLLGLALILFGVPLVTAEASSARLTVNVAGADGSPVTTPYVAVVPEDAPWSRPAREAVLEERAEVSWELPPGRYRIAAGAPGFALDRQPVIELAPGAEARRTVSLVPLVPVAGRVVDEEERPIAGATVSHTRVLLYAYPGALSPLGEGHLGIDFEAATDEEGKFRIALHPEAGSFLAVRAAGRAPRFLPNLRPPGATATLREVTLLPGASLAVRWREEGEGEERWERLQLVPADGVYPAGLDLGGVLAFWARPVTGGVQRWSSLPAGRYEVWLKAPPSGPHTVAPVRLREVVLRRGQAGEVAVEIPKARATERSAVQEGERGRPLDVLLPPVPGSELETLHVTGPVGAEGGREPAWSTEAVSGGVLLRIERGCREGARYLVATSSRVTGIGPLDPGTCDESLRAELHPRADLTLALQAPAGTALADLADGGGRIDLRSCAGPAPPTLDLQIPLPALEEGRLRSPVPAGCLDLAVRVADLAPLSWTGLDAPPGEVVDLGTRRLRRGAALLVRVVAPADRRPLQGVEVGAAPAPGIEGLLAAAAQGRPIDLPGGAAETAAVTDAYGWARLYGLPTGEELVPLLLAPDRRIPVPAEPVVLSPGEELVLEALELPPPAALTVEVELSAALEDRSAEAYQVHLGPMDRDGTRPAVVRPVDADGRARFEEVLPGSYRLMGIVRLASGRSFPAGSKEVEVGPAMDATVGLELDDSLYGGRVTYQGEPVAGAMALTPADHKPGRRGITVRLDEDGRYQALLEGPGHYKAEVTDLQARRFVSATVPEVEFGNPDLPVDIELPGASVRGQVLDEEGQPVAEARVELFGRRTAGSGEGVQHLRRFWRSDEAGRFAIEALGPGSWTIVASAGEQKSAPQTLDVPRDARVGGLRLVLEEGGGVSGQVVDGLGRPAAGARLWISVQPETAGEVLPPIGAVTDAEGRFQVQGVYEGRPANLQVSGPDGLSAAFRVELADGLRLDLPAAGGPLELSLPCDGPLAGTVRDLALVSERGAFLSLVRHASPARDADGQVCQVVWTVPRLAAGPWRLVAATNAPQVAALEAGAGQSLPALADLISRPGEAQVVAVPGASSPTADPSGGHD
jgi:hypothetical protein